MKIAIVGAAGRMGRKLIELAAGEGLEVVSKVDVAEGYDREWPKEVEGVIDFSFHAGVPAFVTKAAEQGIPYVIGTKLNLDTLSIRFQHLDHKEIGARYLQDC